MSTERKIAYILCVVLAVAIAIGAFMLWIVSIWQLITLK